MEKEEILRIIESASDALLAKNLDDDTSFAFKKKGNDGQVGYEWGVMELRDFILMKIE